ncbi:MAG: hypothetical protein ACI4N3_05055 [Alphaproteobacteria bacterium]
MRQIPSLKKPTQPSINILILQTLSKTLYNKEFFYYQNPLSEVENLTYEEAIKYLTNLDTVYFDLNKKEKKLYRKLEEVIKEYSNQK